MYRKNHNNPHWNTCFVEGRREALISFWSVALTTTKTMRFIDDDAKTASTSSAIRKAVEKAKEKGISLSIGTCEFTYCLRISDGPLAAAADDDDDDGDAQLSVFPYLILSLVSCSIAPLCASVSRWQSLTLAACLADFLVRWQTFGLGSLSLSPDSPDLSLRESSWLRLTLLPSLLWLWQL